MTKTEIEKNPKKKQEKKQTNRFKDRSTTGTSQNPKEKNSCEGDDQNNCSSERKNRKRRGKTHPPTEREH